MVRTELKLDIPFIVISFLGQSNNTSKAMEIGATDYLVKPLDPNELIEKIIKHQKVRQ
jgi:DNA-binding response OmpR family regulator